MLCIKQFMSISKCFPGKSFDNWHGGQALCFAHKIPTQMCTEQILAISGSFAYTKSRQWSACCPVECKPWACNKISNFTRGLTFIINDLHFHAMCILEIFLQLALFFYIPFPSKIIAEEHHNILSFIESFELTKYWEFPWMWFFACDWTGILQKKGC